jgi:hypothetical protein
VLPLFVTQKKKYVAAKEKKTQMGVSVLVNADYCRLSVTYCTTVLFMQFSRADAVLTHYITQPLRHVACRKWAQQAVATGCLAEVHSLALPPSNN